MRRSPLVLYAILAAGMPSVSKAADQCALDSMLVQVASAAHQKQPELPEHDEVVRLVVTDHEIFHNEDTHERIKQIQKLVDYVWAHTSSYPRARDSDVALDWQKECEAAARK
ncbi:MAG: hypothetical protein JO307_21015 [Bryobacterales bacterium]|nr:hypothetical protein [Bryobacterales bacterium]